MRLPCSIALRYALLTRQFVAPNQNGALASTAAAAAAAGVKSTLSAGPELGGVGASGPPQSEAALAAAQRMQQDLLQQFKYQQAFERRCAMGTIVEEQGACAGCRGSPE